MGILTQETEFKLRSQLARCQGEFTEEEAQKLIEWAKETEIRHSLLELLYARKVSVSIKNGVFDWRLADEYKKA